jgi:glyoxylase-like metal-dependent hydrolase (beta-lactamase superfamily II)
VAKLTSVLAKEGNVEALAYFSSLEEYNIENTEIRIHYIQNGENVEISPRISLEVIHTPGHTNGSMSYLLNSANADANRGADEKSETSFLFTGDTLFVDSVGRPDLREEAKKYAELLYQTYHQKIVTLPENTLVLPAHFNATSIALKHAEPISETVGSLKKKVKLLSMNEDEFVHHVTDTLPSRPMNYKTIIEINKKNTSI